MLDVLTLLRDFAGLGKHDANGQALSIRDFPKQKHVEFFLCYKVRPPVCWLKPSHD